MNKQEVLALQLKPNETKLVYIDPVSFYELFFPKNPNIVSYGIYEIAQQVKNVKEYSAKAFQEMFAVSPEVVYQIIKEHSVKVSSLHKEAKTQYYKHTQRYLGEVYAGLSALHALVVAPSSAYNAEKLGETISGARPGLTYGEQGMASFQRRIAQVEQKLHQEGGVLDLRAVYETAAIPIVRKESFKKIMSEKFGLYPVSHNPIAEAIPGFSDMPLLVNTKILEGLRYLNDLSSELWLAPKEGVKAENIVFISGAQYRYRARRPAQVDMGRKVFEQVRARTVPEDNKPKSQVVQKPDAEAIVENVSKRGRPKRMNDYPKPLEGFKKSPATLIITGDEVAPPAASFRGRPKRMNDHPKQLKELKQAAKTIGTTVGGDKSEKVLAPKVDLLAKKESATTSSILLGQEPARHLEKMEELSKFAEHTQNTVKKPAETESDVKRKAPESITYKDTIHEREQKRRARMKYSYPIDKGSIGMVEHCVGLIDDILEGKMEEKARLERIGEARQSFIQAFNACCILLAGSRHREVLINRENNSGDERIAWEKNVAINAEQIRKNWVGSDLSMVRLDVNKGITSVRAQFDAIKENVKVAKSERGQLGATGGDSANPAR